MSLIVNKKKAFHLVLFLVQRAKQLGFLFHLPLFPCFPSLHFFISYICNFLKAGVVSKKKKKSPSTWRERNREAGRKDLIIVLHFKTCFNFLNKNENFNSNGNVPFKNVGKEAIFFSSPPLFFNIYFTFSVMHIMLGVSATYPANSHGLEPFLSDSGFSLVSAK